MTESEAIVYGRLAELKAFLNATIERCGDLVKELDHHEVVHDLRSTIDALCEAIDRVTDEADKAQQVLRDRSGGGEVAGSGAE